jgi:hypothetical protein
MSDDEYNIPWEPPNGPAYERDESRTGPPLDYVAEKQRRTLDRLHAALQSCSGEDEATCRRLEEAFQYALVSYLALHNLLGLANDHRRLWELASWSRDDFKAWLDRVQGEGSVTG